MSSAFEQRVVDIDSEDDEGDDDGLQDLARDDWEDAGLTAGRVRVVASSPCMFDMHGPMASLRRRVLKSPRIYLETKVSLVSTLMHSRLLYNSGTWPEICSSAFLSFSHAYVAPVRVATSMENISVGKRTTDAQVLVHASMPSPFAVLVRQRLLLLVRIVRYAPPLLVKLLFALHDYPKSWSFAVKKDIMTLWNGSPELQSMPSPMENFALWITRIHDDPKRLRTKLVRLSRHAVPEQTRKTMRVATHQCPECSRMFPNMKQLLSHAYQSVGLGKTGQRNNCRGHTISNNGVRLMLEHSEHVTVAKLSMSAH